MDFYNFNNLRDAKYVELNLGEDAKSALRSIQETASDSPFVSTDIADFIYHRFRLSSTILSEEEIKLIITDAVRYFRKGNEEEIHQIITSR